MALLPSRLDYTDKDEAALRLRLQKLAASAFPAWTNFEKPNFGNILLELFAHVGGLATFYLDNQAGESRWSTAQLRSSLLSLVKLIGYRPRSARSARVDLTLTFSPAPANDVVIAAGEVFQTQAQVPTRFEVIEEHTISAGTTEYTLTAANRTERTESFSATGLADQELVLSSTPFLEEDLSVSDSNGMWTLVDDFADSTAADRHITATVDANERATLRFGDGVSGAMPQGSITVTYFTGGGSAGLVEAGTVTGVSSNYSDINGNPVFFTVSNADPSSDYADIESVAEIREKAPESLRALNRTVSREDFELNAKQVTGVARALMLTSNEDAGIAENSGILHIIPTTGTNPSTELKNEVLAYLEETKPHTLTFKLTVTNPVYVTVAIRARVFLDAGVTNAAAKANITAALTSFFALTDEEGGTNTAIDFGFNYKDDEGEATGELPLSTLMNVVRNAGGVRKIGDSTSDFLVNLKHQDLDIGIKAFPRLGTITLINGATGVTM